MAVDPVSLAISAALTAASMAVTAAQEFEGPRLQDLSASVADYNTPLNYLLGTRRVECPAFYCEPIREEKKTRKGKGGKMSQYTGFGTWAIALADHGTQQVKRIWFDRHLVYDIDSPTEVYPLADDYALIYHIRFYYGTEDQEPDPRMQAYVEGKEGAGTCPAYRGVSYIFFEDVPLEKIGNRFPQVSVEFSTGTSDIGSPETYEHEDLVDTIDWEVSAYEAAYTSKPHMVSPSQQYIAGADYVGTAYLVDTTDQSLVYKTSWDGVAWEDTESFDAFAVDDQGTIYGGPDLSLGYFGRVDTSSPNTPTLVGTWADYDGNAGGGYIRQVMTFTMPDSSIRVIVFPGADSNNNNHLFFEYQKTGGAFIEHDTRDTGLPEWYPQRAFQDANGDIWITGTKRATGAAINDAMFWRLTNVTGASAYPVELHVTGLPSVDTTSGNPSVVNGVHPEGYFHNGQYVGAWVGTAANVFQVSHLIRIDLMTGDVLAAVAHSDDEWYLPRVQIAAGREFFDLTDRIPDAGGGTGRLMRRIAAADLSVGTTYTFDSWTVPGDDATGDLYLYSEQAFVGWRRSVDYTQGTLRFYFLPDTDVTRLRDLVRFVATQCGLVDGVDYDCEALDQEIHGYSWTQGTGRQIVEAMLTAHDSEPRMHDFQLEFIKRGAEPYGDVLQTEDFVTPDENAKRYTLTETDDLDLPFRLFLQFADKDADQQPNSAVAQRNVGSMGSAKEPSIDMSTFATDIATAKQLVDRAHRRSWFSRGRAENALTRRNLEIEPGDLKTLNFDGEEIIMRASKMEVGAGGIIRCKWEEDHPRLAVLSGAIGAPATGRPPSVIYSPVDSVGWVMDLPLLDDVHEQETPFLYIAAGPVSDGTWSGADIAQSETGEAGTFEQSWDAISGSQLSVIGTIADATPPADPAVIDYGTVITVVVNTEGLTSATLEQILASRSRNLALIGNELVQFMTPTLVAPNTYELRGLVRGARGTEQHIGTHVDNERFVLLESFIRRHPMGAGMIGNNDAYIVSSWGRVPDEDDAQEVLFSAAAHKPLSPVHGSLVRDSGTGDWSASAVRRTRLGGASVDGQDVPLGETSEAWLLEILDAGVPVRTITGTSLPLTYTAAQQTTDFGAPITDAPESKLYQVAPDLNLRGFPLVLA